MKFIAASIMQFEVSKSILGANTEGLDHQDSLVSPEAGGNCLNWIVGHLVTAYDNFVTGTGGETVWLADQDRPYRRHSEPLDPADALPFAQLMDLYQRSHARFVERVAGLTTEELAAPAPYSPGNNPDETVGSLLNLTAFHQSYHVGQTGVLRRIVGRAGAIS